MQDKIQSILNKFPEIQQFTNLQETILKDILLKKDNISRIALFLKAGKGKTILTRAILELLEIKEKDCIVVMTKNLLLSGAWNQFKNRLSKEQFINTESYKFKNKYLIIDEIHFLKEKNTNFYFRYETIKNKIKFLIGLTGTPAPQGDLDFLSLAKMFLDEKYIKSIEHKNTQLLITEILNKLPEDTKYEVTTSNINNFDINILNNLVTHNKSYWDILYSKIKVIIKKFINQIFNHPIENNKYHLSNFDINIKILNNNLRNKNIIDFLYGKIKTLANFSIYSNMSLEQFINYKSIKDELYYSIINQIQKSNKIHNKADVLLIEKSLLLKQEIRNFYKNMFDKYFNIYNDTNEEPTNYKRTIHTHIITINNQDSIDYALSNSLNNPKNYLATFNIVFADYKIKILKKILKETDGQIVLWGYNKISSIYIANKLGINYYTHLTDKQRKQELDNFHTGKNRLIFANPKSASEGLNWQFCKTAIFLSWDDNTKDFIQAIKRIDRLGQKEDINIHFIALNIQSDLKQEHIKLDKLFEKELANNDWIKVDDLTNFERNTNYYELNNQIFHNIDIIRSNFLLHTNE
jgi:hypothetical protein